MHQTPWGFARERYVDGEIVTPFFRYPAAYVPLSWRDDAHLCAGPGLKPSSARQFDLIHYRPDRNSCSFEILIRHDLFFIASDYMTNSLIAE